MTARLQVPSEEMMAVIGMSSDVNSIGYTVYNSKWVGVEILDTIMVLDDDEYTTDFSIPTEAPDNSSGYKPDSTPSEDGEGAFTSVNVPFETAVCETTCSPTINVNSSADAAADATSAMYKTADRHLQQMLWAQEQEIMCILC